jgi:hypothetical protein
MNKKGAEALRAALVETDAAPPSDTAEAVKALGPHLHAASLRLADKRRERQSVGLQALGLAGCNGIFLVVVWLVYQYKALILTNTVQMGIVLGVGILALLLVICLPVFAARKENIQ